MDKSSGPSPARLSRDSHQCPQSHQEQINAQLSFELLLQLLPLNPIAAWNQRGYRSGLGRQNSDIRPGAPQCFVGLAPPSLVHLGTDLGQLPQGWSRLPLGAAFSVALRRHPWYMIFTQCPEAYGPADRCWLIFSVTLSSEILIHPTRCSHLSYSNLYSAHSTAATQLDYTYA